MSNKTYPSSELILHPDGSIYHLNIRPEHLAGNVILVGDPKRVDEISANFDHIEFKNQNREISTHTGTYNGTRITAMSTGMGTDNIDIVVNELDALVNIDLDNRVQKREKQSLNLIRIGTSGALQKDIPVNSAIVAVYGLGMDGLAYYYDEYPHAVDQGLTQSFKKYMNWKPELAHPYGVPASEKLLTKLGKDMIKGITLTAPGFYGPQGRNLRLTTSWPVFFEKIADFEHNHLKITNFEMETSALYGLGKMLGHDSITICMAIANRETGEYSRDYKEHMGKLIKDVLDRLTG
ncbi:MAG: nucleoside phosphorylase [Bacteroidales bacterium]|nr:nucleoside phosphorylase [Bacteroidales bacterium]